jgi:hypothetical protein
MTERRPSEYLRHTRNVIYTTVFKGFFLCVCVRLSANRREVTEIWRGVGTTSSVSQLRRGRTSWRALHVSLYAFISSVSWLPEY